MSSRREVRFAVLLFLGAGWTGSTFGQAGVESVLQPPVVLDAGGPDKLGKDENNGDKQKNGNGQEEEKKNIRDNSFFIEEAYNQEKGVVQHIFNWVPFWDHDDARSREFTFQYTFEMPLGGERNQFSITVPMVNIYERPIDGLIINEGGFADIFLNYRYLLFTDDEYSLRPAIAPRFSLILPSGDEDRGLGSDELGYQFNLPISKELPPFAFHFNAGFTFIPDVDVVLPDGRLSPQHDLHGWNLGGSIIWLVNYDFNLMLEAVAFWEEEIDELGFTPGTHVVLLNPGFRWAVYTAEDIQWVLGLGVPIGLSEHAPDIGIFGYMSVEHTARKQKKNGNGG